MAKKGSEITAAERRVEATRLRAGGASYRQIGQQLGTSHTQARADVLAGLRLLEKQLAEESALLAALEWQRLELPLVALANAIKRKEVKDYDLAKLVDAWRALSESRRKLRGLDKASKHEHSGPGGAPIPILTVEVVKPADAATPGDDA